MQMNKRVAFLTIGCKLNFSETSAIAREFEMAGYRRVSEHEAADVYVVNTCSVTEHADKKSRQAIRRLLRLNPKALIAVTGCYAQLRPAELADIGEQCVVFGTRQKGALFSTVHALVQGNASAKAELGPYRESFFPAFSMGDRTRSFLKVQDGCNYCCTYCTVPLARGESRNLSIDSLCRQARTVAANGVREIIITGVNIGDFGRSTSENFFDLLKALETVEGIERLRISSIEPDLLSPSMIVWIGKHPKYMPHFHIPLQSGSDPILKAMRRRYTTALFKERINLIRENVADAFIGLDVIVGFPGETEDDFAREYAFLQEVEPSYLHLFPFSLRPNTPAAKIPVTCRVPEAVKTARLHRLRLFSDARHKAFCREQTGKTLPVLFESASKRGMMFGYTPNYVKIQIPYDPSIVGRIVPVTLGPENIVY